MKFRPKENFVFRTKLSEEEVLRRLSGIMRPEKMFRFKFFLTVSPDFYQGEIKGKSFRIQRIIYYKNSFLPLIQGTIEGGLAETSIKVQMRMSIFVIVFLWFWFSGVSIACLMMLFVMFVGNLFHPAMLIPFGMLIFVYALIKASFTYESRKSKQYLKTLFEAEII